MQNGIDRTEKVAEGNTCVKGEQHRVLHKPVVNPFFRHGYTRGGLASVRCFHAGTPMIVRKSGKPFNNFFALAGTIMIAIPALRIPTIFDLKLLGQFLNASMPVAPSLPTGETYVACEICHGVTWRNTMKRGDNSPMHAVCTECGNKIKVVPLFFAAGHA